MQNHRKQTSRPNESTTNLPTKQAQLVPRSAYKIKNRVFFSKNVLAGTAQAHLLLYRQ